jgi:transposase
MHATTVGVDLAKHSVEVAFADEPGRIRRRAKLSRRRFALEFANQPPCLIVMEACGSAHHWGRTLQQQGHEVRLLPAQYTRAYVRRNKTDAADAAALIEAARCADIRPVPVKSVDQQVIQHLHRLRQQYTRTRTGRINLLRGYLREYGVAIPTGLQRGMHQIREVLTQQDCPLPQALHPFVFEVLQELTDLQQRLHSIEATLHRMSAEDAVVRELIKIPGVGELSATALRAAVGDVHRFASGRHFASWLGLTAREHSSAERRRLGGISKQGDTYLRTLLVHGARSALLAAQRAQRAGRPLDRLRQWALATQQRCGTNKATVALANKLARIIWASWRYQRPFDGNWCTPTQS